MANSINEKWFYYCIFYYYSQYFRFENNVCKIKGWKNIQHLNMILDSTNYWSSVFGQKEVSVSLLLI